MPLAFLAVPARLEGVPIGAGERNFLHYLEELVGRNEDDDPSNDYNVAVRIEVQLRRTKEGSATPFTITNDPDALPVRIDEADILEKYPWSYDMLTARLQRRYSDFKVNDRYHGLRRPLEVNENLCHCRLLDPGNPASSSKKRLYNSNILKEFDQHYQRRAPEVPAKG